MIGPVSISVEMLARLGAVAIFQTRLVTLSRRQVPPILGRRSARGQLPILGWRRNYAEGAFDWLLNSNNSNTTTASNGNSATVTINNRWLTTATGRLGYAWDRVLLYGKAGGAWVGGSSPGLTINGVPTLLFWRHN
jgi:hypothetical protein